MKQSKINYILNRFENNDRATKWYNNMIEKFGGIIGSTYPNFSVISVSPLNVLPNTLFSPNVVISGGYSVVSAYFLEVGGLNKVPLTANPPIMGPNIIYNSISLPQGMWQLHLIDQGYNDIIANVNVGSGPTINTIAPSSNIPNNTFNVNIGLSSLTNVVSGYFLNNLTGLITTIPIVPGNTSTISATINGGLPKGSYSIVIIDSTGFKLISTSPFSSATQILSILPTNTVYNNSFTPSCITTNSEVYIDSYYELSVSPFTKVPLTFSGLSNTTNLTFNSLTGIPIGNYYMKLKDDLGSIITSPSILSSVSIAATSIFPKYVLQNNLTFFTVTLNQDAVVTSGTLVNGANVVNLNVRYIYNGVIIFQGSPNTGVALSVLGNWSFNVVIGGSTINLGNVLVQNKVIVEQTSLIRPNINSIVNIITNPAPVGGQFVSAAIRSINSPFTSYPYTLTINSGVYQLNPTVNIPAGTYEMVLNDSLQDFIGPRYITTYPNKYTVSPLSINASSITAGSAYRSVPQGFLSSGVFVQWQIDFSISTSLGGAGGFLITDDNIIGNGTFGLIAGTGIGGSFGSVGSGVCVDVNGNVYERNNSSSNINLLKNYNPGFNSNVSSPVNPITVRELVQGVIEIRIKNTPLTTFNDFVRFNINGFSNTTNRYFSANVANSNGATIAYADVTTFS